MKTCNNCGAYQEPFDVCRNCKGKGAYNIPLKKLKQPKQSRNKKVLILDKKKSVDALDRSNKRQEHRPPMGKHPDLKELSRFIARSLKKDVITCEQCGCGGMLHVHHKDKNPFNNSLENLIKLCLKHHKEQHKGDGVYRIMK